MRIDLSVLKGDKYGLIKTQLKLYQLRYWCQDNLSRHAPLTHLNVGAPGSCHTRRAFLVSQLPGTAMDAIDYIQRDHRNLYAVVYTLNYLARELADSGTEPNLQLFALMLDYVGSFQDEYHHPKEDAFLFPALIRHDEDAAKTVRRLEQQHQTGYQMLDSLNRAFVRLAADPGSERARFAEAVADYATFQREHISLEEQSILKNARDVIPAAELKKVTAAFADNADPMFGEIPSAKFRGLMKKIVQIAPDPMGFGPRAKKA